MSEDVRSVRTDHLVLDAPCLEDLEELHTLYSDPRVWTHVPTGRFADIDQTASMVRRWMDGWDRAGLGPWIVRERPGGPLIGNGGCDLRGEQGGEFWNLGYRLVPEVQGRGIATELSEEGLRRAQDFRPDLPVVAYLLEHNHGSRRVAEKVGLSLRRRAPEPGHPDPGVYRIVLADRELTDEQARTALL